MCDDRREGCENPEKFPLPHFRLKAGLFPNLLISVELLNRSEKLPGAFNKGGEEERGNPAAKTGWRRQMRVSEDGQQGSTIYPG